MPERRRTATSNFGVGRRESHDASAFYERFRPPIISDDETVLPPVPVAEPFVLGDARKMDTIADGSVALVVTSPPYFAGKQYEQELEREGVPGSYLEYLDLLRSVFAECVRTLETGGRMAVNVANLGRKPYRSLSADVIRILQDDLGLLLRGELVWQKGEGASGSCAWGSFRSAANPVLRDITERVVIASKGRFDRAQSIRRREQAELPYENSLMSEEFMALTLDVWSIPPERARRVGHPAPFPVELPEQLIRLYTYKGDLVLDPFMGSGSTLVAAAMLDRRYVGYDLDPSYLAIAERRVAEVISAPTAPEVPKGDGSLPSGRLGTSLESSAVAQGKSAKQIAEDALLAAGFTIEKREAKIAKTGVIVNLVASDATGGIWWFDVPGAFTSHRDGLLRSDLVWRTLGRAHALRGRNAAGRPLVLLATHLPAASSEGDLALRAAGPAAFFDAVELFDPAALERLRIYAAGGRPDSPMLGFWSGDELTTPA
jgi:site-specific DNA-methyltransferase (adenine-specific)